MQAVHVASSALPVLFLVNLQTHGFVQVPQVRRQHSLINRPETPPLNLIFHKYFFLWLVWGQTTKYRDGQYFWLYSSFFAVLTSPQCTFKSCRRWFHVELKIVLISHVLGDFLETVPWQKNNIHFFPPSKTSASQ